MLTVTFCAPPPQPVKGLVHEVINILPPRPRTFPRDLSTSGELHIAAVMNRTA
jgi:hypothetical protein